MKWTTKGFDAFRKGTFGNGGQNLYVTASGTLQRIFNFDVNGDGYVDLPLANSHSMNERPPMYIYDRPGQEAPLCLPTNGAFDAIFTDLSGIHPYLQRVYALTAAKANSATPKITRKIPAFN